MNINIYDTDEKYYEVKRMADGCLYRLTQSRPEFYVLYDRHGTLVLETRQLHEVEAFLKPVEAYLESIEMLLNPRT
jgi:hypothetical protein